MELNEIKFSLYGYYIIFNITTILKFNLYFNSNRGRITEETLKTLYSLYREMKGVDLHTIHLGFDIKFTGSNHYFVFFINFVDSTFLINILENMKEKVSQNPFHKGLEVFSITLDSKYIIYKRLNFFISAK